MSGFEYSGEGASDPRRHFRKLFSALCILCVAGAAISKPAVADEVDAIGNPLVDDTQIMVMAVSPTTSFFSVTFLEGWRQWGLAMVDIAKDNERQAMLAAITTHAILQVDKAVRTSKASAETILEKLRGDLRHYEDRFPDFRTRRDPPTDPDDLRYYRRYQAIKQVLDNEGAALQKAADGAIGAIETLRTRLSGGKFILKSLESQNGFIMRAMNDYHARLTALDAAVTKLNESGASPRIALRAIIKNDSENLVFFVQIIPRTQDGKYDKVRADTRFPSPIYPKQPPPSQQSVTPKGQRGPNRAWFTIKPWDKIVIRVATMGPIRDKVRFQPITGSLVRPDLSSLERGFYWLGYNTKQPTRVVPIFTRLYSKQESYRWQFRGGWAPGESANDPAFKPAADRKALQQALGHIWPGHTGFANARVEWILPSSMRSAVDLGSGYADVSGTTTYEKVGPTARQRSELKETGSGRLRLLIERW